MKLKVPAKNFLAVLTLATLTISIIALSSFMAKRGVSFDIREKAAYATPTLPPPNKGFSLSVETCKVNPNSGPTGRCQGRVTWSSSNLIYPILRQKIGGTWTVLSLNPLAQRVLI
jgi:hypothetical protein